MSGEIPTKIKDALFVATHPILSLRAKGRQIMVAIEHEAPPLNTTLEEFPELTVAEAARRIKSAEIKESGGVPKSAWSKSDQERMDKGLRPLGHPEHPNV